MLELHVALPGNQEALTAAAREAEAALRTADIHGSVLFEQDGLRIVVLAYTTEERVRGLLSNCDNFQKLFSPDGSVRKNAEATETTPVADFPPTFVAAAEAPPTDAIDFELGEDDAVGGSTEPAPCPPPSLVR